MAAGVEIEFDRAGSMRDGVELRADVYRPVGTGPWPVLLMRTPYGKGVVSETLWNGIDPAAAARRGFITVVQDTRGRFASDGRWSPLRHERQDGHDTVEWAARLPGANGRAGMFGGSYCGNTQWMAAIERPPSLAAIAPLMTWSDPHDGLFSRGGAIELGLSLTWTLQTGVDWAVREAAHPTEAAGEVAAIAAEWDALGTRGFWELPVRDMAALRRHGAPELGALTSLDSPEIVEWTQVAGHHHRVEVPSFHTGGWFDVFLQGTLDNYQAMAALGHPARLVVGPWAHERFLDPVGDALFGIRSARDGLPVHPYGDWGGYQLAWFDRYLAGSPAIDLPDKPVRIFVMGRNEWRDESAWPPARAIEERWFMHHGGSLSTSPPRPDAVPSEFLYDPSDPVPTAGGQTLIWPGFPPGPVDQGPVERRDDVLVFTTEPLAADLEVTGRIRARLAVESTAPSTDWVVRLCDVGPDGRSLNLCDGIVRADAADATAAIDVDLWSISNVFLRGHRIRIQVTSSCFPRWDRNLNTGFQDWSHFKVARQRLFHGTDRASFVTLPVIAA